MRAYWLIPLALSVAGCATHQRSARLPAAQPAQSQPKIAGEPVTTRIVETRYEIRPYRDAADPAVRHEAHAVYRSTRVPVRVEELETAPRAAFPPASFAPLPANAELAAELSTQKQITEQLRAIQAKMTSVEEQARQQYGTLVTQTQESVKLARQLEIERARVRELEAMLRDRAAPPEKVPAAVAATSTPEMKW